MCLALTEFGSLTEVTDAFVRSAPGRRTARLPLATGPPLGAAWGASLAVGQSTAVWSLTASRSMSNTLVRWAASAG